MVGIAVAMLALVPISAAVQAISPSTIRQVFAPGGQVSGGNYVMQTIVGQPIFGSASGGAYLAAFGFRFSGQETTGQAGPSGLYLPVLSAQRSMTQ